LILVIVGFSEGHRIGHLIREGRAVAEGSDEKSEQTKAVLADREVSMVTSEHPQLQERAEPFASLDASKKLKAIMEYPEWQRLSKLFAEWMRAVATNPRVQERATRASELVTKMMKDQDLQNHVGLALEQFEAITEDPQFQERLKLLATQMETMMADPTFAAQGFQECSNLVSEQLRVIMEGSHFQERSRLFAEHMNNFTIHPEVQELVKLASEHARAIMEDPDLQEHAKLASEQFKVVMENLDLKEHAELLTEAFDDERNATEKRPTSLVEERRYNPLVRPRPRAGGHALGPERSGPARVLPVDRPVAVFRPPLVRRVPSVVATDDAEADAAADEPPKKSGLEGMRSWFKKWASFDKEKLKTFGVDAFFTYGVVSNINAGFLVTLAWMTFSQSSGMSPLAPGAWKKFAATYGALYISLGSILRPVRFAVAAGSTPYYTALVARLRKRLPLRQQRPQLNRGLAMFIVALLLNVGLTFGIVFAGVSFAGLVTGVPPFPPGWQLGPFGRGAAAAALT